MAISCFSARSLVGLLAAATAAALLAGCGGSQALSPLGAAQSGQALSRSHAMVPTVRYHCPAHGGVRVTPCSVNLTASSPGPDTVAVRTPRRKKGTLAESDNCGGASGIATVTQGSGNTWIVTAGATTGSCTATFDFLSGRHNKIVGWANLNITNSI